MWLQVLTCILRVYKTSDHKSVDDVVRCYDFDIPPDRVAAYFCDAAPPLPVSETPSARAQSPLTALLMTATVTAPAARASPSRCEPVRDIAETLNRLAKPNRPPAIGNTSTVVGFCFDRLIYTTRYAEFPKVCKEILVLCWKRIICFRPLDQIMHQCRRFVLSWWWNYLFSQHLLTNKVTEKALSPTGRIMSWW